MSESVVEIRIIGQGKNIFDTDTGYTIPLYQRAFAWEDRHLSQLVEDISGIPEGADYCIGTLIVSRQREAFEVVDGQQRLTALYLLLSLLGVEVKNTLSFACRDKSNYTLRNVGDLLPEGGNRLDMDRVEPGILRGMRILAEQVDKTGLSRQELLGKLERVLIYRIEVPENTDLNRYFEIMNTRGEQLEQHDILKASLMSVLADEQDRETFAKIWEACSDMTGYVQMHFVSPGNWVRDRLFKWDWNTIPPEHWEAYRSSLSASSGGGGGYKITDIILPDFSADADAEDPDSDVRVRFESVVTFPYFLLHTLKVLIAVRGIRHEDGTSALTPELLDDKKLVETFEHVILHGVADGGKLSEDRARFSVDFIICLLRTRFLFDKYVIKREYANENADGVWSMKSLKVSGRSSNKKPQYSNSWFMRSREWSKFNEERVKKNIMIQSALRVSYTSPKAMHWITRLLIWLSENGGDDMAQYHTVAESIAGEAVRESFFRACGDGNYAMGANTPHIVFNYLDYLLWSSKESKYAGFVFEFRNSVEHWYPQNPSEGTFEQWKDGVDRFGNLCIVQRSVNSRFSNMSPEAKKSTFTDMISKGSLKLRGMSDLTEPHGAMSASLYWRETGCGEHEDEMLGILKKACGIVEPAPESGDSPLPGPHDADRA